MGSSAFAAPFLAIGDNAELFVTADASAAYNDNILLSSHGNELEDTVLTFVPGFDLEYGKDSLLKGSLIGTATLTSYADNDNLNNQLLGISNNSSYESGGLKLKFVASHNELDQATVDVTPTSGKLVERHVSVLGGSGELEVSQKFSVGAGLTFSTTDYKETGYVEEDTYTVPVNVYYELTPKVDLSAGVTYIKTNLDDVAAGQADEYDAYYYNVGARGSFTPKLSGAFSVGYNTRSANVGPDDDGSFGADASLTYAYTDKTQFTLALSRNYSNATVGGDSYENSQITLGASSAIAVDWRLNAAITYRQLDYQNVSRTDDYYEGTVGATYIINSSLSAGLSYIYREQTSDGGSEFRNNVVTVSLSARY
ncbi:MAG TPA: outer membrane beta-barrel protein [Rariglobus sp.]